MVVLDCETVAPILEHLKMILRDQDTNKIHISRFEAGVTFQLIILMLFKSLMASESIYYSLF